MLKAVLATGIGREYFRALSLRLRQENAYDLGDPLPSQLKKGLITDLTGDDLAFFYDN